MSHFSGRGRPNLGGARPGLLGAAPGARRPGLLDSLPPRDLQNQHFSQYNSQQSYTQNIRNKTGLLGNAPIEYPRQQPRKAQQAPTGYERQPHFYQPREEDYSYDQPPQKKVGTYTTDNYEYEQQGHPPRITPVDHLTPQVKKLMVNLGLSKSDMEELSRLPGNELSPNTLSQAIKTIREKKTSDYDPIQQSDLRNVISSHQERDLSRHSFNAHRRSSSPENMYDPSEPTDDYTEQRDHYDDENFDEENEPEDAFSTFEQKWYSESDKKINERERNEQQSTSSILRGSRGPAAKASRWEPDERAQNHSNTQRRPSPIRRRQSSPLMQRTPPMPRRSPPRRISPLRRITPPKTRLNLSAPIHHQRGGLLGDPRAPSTNELDLLAATISGGRKSAPVNPPPKSFRPSERHYPDPQRFQEPMRLQEPMRQSEPMQSRESHPPPLMAQITSAPTPTSQKPSNNVLEAQIKAMQVLKSETSGPQARGPGGKKPVHTIHDVQAAAAKMRKARGRVLYFRYQAGGMGIICEQDLVKLAQPFEKVTNILFVAPKNLIKGWYQAFVELAEFDGAAAMLEQYMTRPPMIKNIPIQVQRSKHQTLQLREHQMNRDFDSLVDESRKPRSGSLDRSNQRSVERSKRPRERSRTGSRDRKSQTPKDSNKDSRASNDNLKSKLDVLKNSNKESKNSDEKLYKTETKIAKLDSESSDTHSESFRLVDEVIEKMDEKIIAIIEPTEVENGKDENIVIKKDLSNESVTFKQNAKKAANRERLDIIAENIEQASNMTEALLEIVQQKSTKDTISEVLEYLADSLSQIKNMEE